MNDACELLAKGSIRICFECENFPCKRLKALDKRYRTKYRMSMIENNNFIKEFGMEEFLKKEHDKWLCPECGATICCHNGLCLNCSIDTLIMDKKYRVKGRIAQKPDAQRRATADGVADCCADNI